VEALITTGKSKVPFILPLGFKVGQLPEKEI